MAAMETRQCKKQGENSKKRHRGKRGRGDEQAAVNYRFKGTQKENDLSSR